MRNKTFGAVVGALAIAGAVLGVGTTQTGVIPDADRRL